MNVLNFTKAQQTALPALYSTEDVALEDKIAVVKLFTSWGSWTWYVIEYDGQDQCFGLVVGNVQEFGYFSLNELRTVTGPYGLGVERDIHFTTTRVRELLKMSFIMR